MKFYQDDLLCNSRYDRQASVVTEFLFCISDL